MDQKTDEKTSSRIVQMDLIRLIALFCVNSVHFFLHCGYYKLEIDNLQMYLMTIIRSASTIGVPLFMILSGYLLRSKRIESYKYSKIIRIIVIYILASIANILYKHIFLGYYSTLKDAIKSIFDFSGANYSWYVEMYLGFFLLIPFLNVVWNGIDKRKRKILIVSLIFLTALPGVVNVYNFDAAGWVNQPSLSQDY